MWGGRDKTQHPVTLPYMKVDKQIWNFSGLVTFYLIYLLSQIYFAKDCLKKQIFVQNSSQSPSNFNILKFFMTKNLFSKQTNYRKIPNLRLF